MKNKGWIAVALLVMFSMLLVGCQAGPTADEIVDRVNELEASVNDVHAIVEISGTYPDGSSGESVIEFWEKRPDKFRAEILESTIDEQPVGAVVSSNGDQMWAYDPDKNRVAVGDPESVELEDGVNNPREMVRTLENQLKKVLETNTVENVGEEELLGKPCYKLVVTPKEDSDADASGGMPEGGKAEFWVDQEQWIILQAHFNFKGAVDGWVKIRSYEFNTGFDDEVFDYEIPDGVEVVDLEDLSPRHLTLDEAQAEADFDLLLPGYVPDEATLVDVFVVEGVYVMHYNHSDLSFTLMQGASPDSKDLPAGKVTDLTVREQPATLVTDEEAGNSFLTWEEDGNTIRIAGHLSSDEILKLAESLE